MNTPNDEEELMRFVAQLDQLIGVAATINAEFAFELAALSAREDCVAELRRLRRDAEDHEGRLAEVKRRIANSPADISIETAPRTPAEIATDAVEQTFGTEIWKQ